MSFSRHGCNSKKLFLILLQVLILLNDKTRCFNSTLSINSTGINESNSTVYYFNSTTQSFTNATAKTKLRENNDTSIIADLEFKFNNLFLLKKLNELLHNHNIHKNNRPNNDVNAIGDNDDDDEDGEGQSTPKNIKNFNRIINNSIYDNKIDDFEDNSNEKYSVELNDEINEFNDIFNETVFEKTVENDFDNENFSTPYIQSSTTVFSSTTTVQITPITDVISSTTPAPSTNATKHTYPDNPQFLECINSCGTDHDCVRTRCLSDSTYFG